MPRNASGNFTLPAVYRATPGTTVRSDQHNTPLEDIAQSLTDSLPRNGSAPMTGNLSMGGRRITGLGAPTEASDAATRGYVDGIRTSPARTDMAQGVVGRSALGNGAASTLTLGAGLEFSGSSIRARIGTGISFVAGAIAAAVTRFATQGEATAGTNNEAAMTPLRVQEYAAANLIGVSQSWQGVLADRAFNVVYTNNTGRPIMVAVSGDTSGSPSDMQVSANGTTWVNVGRFGEAGQLETSVSTIVPNGHRYRIVGGGLSFNYWTELR